MVAKWPALMGWPQREGQSELYQRSRTGRINTLRDSLQGCGLCDCGDWLGRSEIREVGGQEGRAGTVGHELKLLSMGRVSFSSGKP